MYLMINVKFIPLHVLVRACLCISAAITFDVSSGIFNVTCNTNCLRRQLELCMEFSRKIPVLF